MIRRQRSDPPAPQHLPSLTIDGLIHKLSGLPVKLAVRTGVDGSHGGACPETCGTEKKSIAEKSKVKILKPPFVYL